MHQLNQLRALVDSETWQPTKDDIRYLLHYIDYNRELDTLAMRRFEKITSLVDGVKYGDSDANAVVELMAYHANQGIESINSKIDVEELLDEIARLQHANKNVINPNLEAEISAIQRMIDEQS
jgi:hypothetical protein